jgi:two-component system, cell cycle response regulator
VTLAENAPIERRQLATRAGRDRLASWLEIHPSGLASLPRESVEALCALLDVAWHATVQGRQYRREAATLRQAARRLRDLANQDALTGLANRRAIEERLAAEWDRANRYERPLALLIGDLDDLKAVNDKYGHAVGDALLQQAAEVMRLNLRAGDLAGRLGGDEFVVLCPETDHEAAALVANKLNQALRDATIDTPEGKLGLRMSIGWAVAADAAGHAELMHLADQALYQVKAQHRGASA